MNPKGMALYMGESFQDHCWIQDFEADFLWKVSLKSWIRQIYNGFSDLDLFIAYLKDV